MTDFIEKTAERGSKPGLERIRKLLEYLGNPQKNIKSIQIAGTNGKGSVSNMLSEILTASGYRVGLFTSPAVVETNEMIKISGVQIPEKFAEKYSEILEKYDEIADDKPTQFEFLTAMAMLYFSEQQVDCGIFEAGMGGAEDSTNVAENVELCVFTAIGMDHMEFLGSTISEITRNKGGILKKEAYAVFNGEERPAKKELKMLCREKNIPLQIVDRRSLKVNRCDEDGVEFNYKEFKNLKVKMAGIYQSENGALTIEACKMLQNKGWKIDENAIRQGLFRVKLPARFEIICKKPLIIYDGGHNPNGAVKVAENLSIIAKHRQITAVMSVMRDKNYEKILEIYAPYLEKLYAVPQISDRALEPEALVKAAKKAGLNAEKTEKNITEIIEGVGSDGAVIIVGTLYYYKKIKDELDALRRVNMEGKIINIAIDGPSGAGKSTVAKAIAKDLKIGYLDTGAMYRTIALFMDRMVPELEKQVENGKIEEATRQKIVELLEKSNLRVVYEDGVQKMYIGDEEVNDKIRTPKISMEASKVSAIPEVRVYLVEMQREIGSKNSIIMDGRDIGTHVLPDATVKIYLTASAEERAKRRYLELAEKGQTVDYETVLQDIKDRDYGDMNRAVSPLKQAEDAILLDTSSLTLEESVKAAKKIIAGRI